MIRRISELTSVGLGERHHQYAGDSGDFLFITELGGRVFADLGPYAFILGEWLARPGVTAWIVDGIADEPRRAFAMLAFYREGPLSDSKNTVADLLALAVEPAHQGSGLGSRLLAHVIAAAAAAAAAEQVVALRLTVAADQVAAQRMYARAGFALVPEKTTSYPSGKLGVQMSRPLP